VGFAAALWAAAAGAALVEQHGVEAFGIEQPAMVRLAAAAGPAMQVDRCNAADATDAFDIDVVTVADDELLRRQRSKRIGALDGFAGVGVRRHARLPSPACRRRNCDRGSGPGARPPRARRP